MQTANQPSKVTARHLSRAAVVYVRQSTPRQVLENQESTRRQYGLRERALSLGWHQDQIETIDTDLGLSGASATDRAGFQRLVGEVAMGRVGIVLGLEVSRLARNSSDWHRLLELCALADTLILDEDGLYDPSHFNDRLLLGLKGTMSEAELHVLRARLRGGLLAKAARGELRIPLPVGLCYDAVGRVVLHPDVQVQAAIRLFFETFARTGAAFATVKYFEAQGLQFPHKLQGRGADPSAVVWGHLSLSRAVVMLRSPRYAGAYAFGRTRTRKRVDGGWRSEPLPREQWHTILPGAHAGYLTWEQFDHNLAVLHGNAVRFGQDKRDVASYLPREGPALLQGLALCGKCGRKMTIRYQFRKGKTPGTEPAYVCLLGHLNSGEPLCQTMPGKSIDAAISRLVCDTMTPMALQCSLAVQAELQSRQDDAERLRQRQVERAAYEVELARRRYLQVDPSNRLVASTLEVDWNDRLRDLEQTRADAQRQRQADDARLDAATRERILTLSNDFAAVWHHARTPDRERKRMLALMVHDVTLTRGDCITVQVRFRGGNTTELSLPVPEPAWRRWQTHPDAMALIRQWAKEFSNQEIADRLNALGYRGGMGNPFTLASVEYLVLFYRLGGVQERIRHAGHLSCLQMTELLSVSPSTIKNWRQRGELRSKQFSGRDWGYLPIVEQPEPIRQRAQSVAQSAPHGPNIAFHG